MMEVSIEQITGEDDVVVEIPGGITLEDGTLRFDSMEELAEFSDALAAHAKGWRADEKFSALTGIRKMIADALVETMRAEIIKTNPGAADVFPDDALFGGQWLINLTQIEQMADDFDGLRISIETHVKDLIVSLAETFAVAREVSDQRGGAKYN